MGIGYELIQVGGSSGLCAALFTHGIALPHIVNWAASSGESDLVDRFVRPTLAGALIGSLAVTEPDGGSDVASLRTRAERDGDSYVVNGTKTFITSGARADFITTAVRTGGPGHAGISLLVVPTDTPGLSIVRRLEKMGWHCSDTAELAFVDCRVPAANLIGAEGSAFVQIAQNFAGERLGLATQAYATAQRCLDLTVAYAKQRMVFGNRREDSASGVCFTREKSCHMMANWRASWTMMATQCGGTSPAASGSCPAPAALRCSSRSISLPRWLLRRDGSRSSFSTAAAGSDGAIRGAGMFWMRTPS